MSSISFSIPLKTCKNQDEFDRRIFYLCDALKHPNAYSLKLDRNTNTLIVHEKKRDNEPQLTEKEIGEFCQNLISMNTDWVSESTLASLKKWKELKIEGFDLIAKDLVWTVDLMVRKKLGGQVLSSSSSTAPLGLDDEPPQQKSSSSSDDNTTQLLFFTSSEGARISFDRKLLKSVSMTNEFMREFPEENTLDFSKAGTGSLTSTEVVRQFQAYLNKEGVRAEGSLEPLYRFADYVGCDALMKDILLSSMRSRERPLTPFLFNELISRGFNFSVKELGIIEEYLEHREAWQALAVNFCQELLPIDPNIKAQIEKLEKLYNELPLAEDKAEMMVHIEALLREIENEHPEITDPIAQLFLSQCFLHGINLKSDLKRAFLYAKKSADQGNLLAKTFAGVYYSKGIGCVEENKEKAISYFTPAAERGLARAQCRLGILYESMGDPRLAFQWVEKAAKKGYAEAEYQLGRYFELGIGGPSNAEESKELAFQWVEKAAKKGIPAAQNALGAHYETGVGVEKNLKKAFENFMMAANQGDRVGQFNLARFYKLGLGMGKDLVQAFQWFERAAEQELAPAQREVGLCYLDGVGVKKDEDLAFDFFKSAAEQGDAEAQYRVGWFFETGRVRSKKYPQDSSLEARDWYRKAADQLHIRAIAALNELLGEDLNQGLD